MEAAKIIRKIAAYILFVGAATFFFYQMVILMTSMYIDHGADVNAYYLNQVFKPFMYALLCLAIMLISEFALIGKENKYITSLMLIILFGVGLAVSIFILVKGIISIPNNKICQDPSFFYYIILPLMIICVGEIVYGIFMYFSDKKEKAKLKEEDKEKTLKQDGVNLTKE